MEWTINPEEMKVKFNPWAACFTFWVLVIMLVWCTTTCSAQTQQKAYYDTCYCKIDCIKKFVSKPSANSKTERIYAVYIDEHNDISELIPVSKTVFNYIQLCRSNGIQPNLGIKLRNGQISSIIKYQRRYAKKS